MTWLPENLFHAGQINNLLELSFFSSFLSWVIVICICVKQKKSQSNEIMLTGAWYKQEENENWLTDGTRQYLSAQVSKGPLFLGCCISKAIKLGILQTSHIVKMN